MPKDPESKTDEDLTINADRGSFQDTDLIPRTPVCRPIKN